MTLGNLHWRWRGSLGLWRLWHRPHVHCNCPVRFNHRFPNLGKNNLAIRPNQVIMAILDVRANDVHVKECLFDEIFHALLLLVRFHTTESRNLLPMFGKGGMGS